MRPVPGLTVSLLPVSTGGDWYKSCAPLTYKGSRKFKAQCSNAGAAMPVSRLDTTLCQTSGDSTSAASLYDVTNPYAFIQCTPSPTTLPGERLPMMSRWNNFWEHDAFCTHPETCHRLSAAASWRARCSQWLIVAWPGNMITAHIINVSVKLEFICTYVWHRRQRSNEHGLVAA